MKKRTSIYLILLLLSLPCILYARQVETFYGPIEVEEPVLLELIDTPIFQRLKNIHQYGVSYYTTHKEEYNRYDHSIGVFAILRVNNCSLEEQIAGLLHDVSHTVFSHVGDWIFGKEHQEKDYQNSIHPFFLERSGLANILGKYGITVDQILPNGDLFPALENSLPNLCADRIDYNIQGAYYQDFITYEEAKLIFADLRFINNRWVSHYPELMVKLTRFSLFMTQHCWGSPSNYLVSRWLADAILRGVCLGDLSYNELHFGTDHAIWDKLVLQKDPIIEIKMKMIMNAQDYFSIVDFTDEADYVIKSKFRGIDPWVVSAGECYRITELDKELAQEYMQVRQIIKSGWPIKFTAQDLELNHSYTHPSSK